MVREVSGNRRPRVMELPEQEEEDTGQRASAAGEFHKHFTVESSEAGQRLDRAVALHCAQLSRTRVQELIDAGLVLVDGSAAKKGSVRLRGGEEITVEAPERPVIVAKAEAIPLDVLYEDGDVIAINKPAGMMVHAGAGNVSGTLVNALLGRGQALSQGGDPLRPGIVHRLDKETSGVILIAKNDAAHAKLVEAFRQRAVKKTYVALVQGILKEKSGRIELAIGRDPIHRTRMTTPRKSWRGAAISRAREASTDWRALAKIGNTTLVEVQLHTGRTHQIRVHRAETSGSGRYALWGGVAIAGRQSRLPKVGTQLSARGEGRVCAAEDGRMDRGSRGPSCGTVRFSEKTLRRGGRAARSN